MSEGIFRKKSMDKIASPEQLDDYIKVSNPSVWMILSCVIFLLLGMCVWGIFGKLNTVTNVPVISKDGKTFCYLKEEQMAAVSENMKIEIGDDSYVITSVSSKPVQMTEDEDAYLLHKGDFQVGEWVYEASSDAVLDEGFYEGKIITESVAPISFLWN